MNTFTIIHQKIRAGLYSFEGTFTVCSNIYDGMEIEVGVIATFTKLNFTKEHFLEASSQLKALTRFFL